MSSVGVIDTFDGWIVGDLLCFVQISSGFSGSEQ